MDRFFFQVAFILEDVIRYQIEKGYKWRIRVKEKFKGGLISEKFSLLIKSPKVGTLGTIHIKMLRGEFWNRFLEI